MVKLNNELLNDETMRKYQKAMTAKQWQEFEQDSLKFQKVLLGLDLENGLKVQQGRINALNIRYKKAETGMLEFEFDDASRKHRLKNQPVNSVSDFTGLFVDYMNYISNKIVIDAPDAVIKFFTKGK